MINATQEEAEQPAESCTCTLPTDSVVSTQMSEYHDIFSGLGKHKHIKAKLIVDEIIQPGAHKQRRIPYNLAQKATHEELRLREGRRSHGNSTQQLTYYLVYKSCDSP